MDYQTVTAKDAAKALGANVAALRYHLNKRRVPGAYLKENRWYIPIDSLDKLGFIIKKGKKK